MTAEDGPTTPVSTVEPEIDEEDWSQDDDAQPEHAEAEQPKPEEWDQSVGVYNELAKHAHLRQSPAALKTARDAVNEHPRPYWRNKARRMFDAVIERNLFAAAEPAPPGHIRSFDVLPYPKLQYNLTRGMNWYASNHGFEASIFHPARFSEKLLVTKLFAPLPMPSPGDKLGVERYIPPAWRTVVRPAKRFWESHLPVIPEEIDAPPGVYYLKANHSSGANEKITLPLSESDREELSKLAKRWLNFDYGLRGGEWWYQLVQRKVYIEESFSDIGASAPDWKFFVLSGRVAMVQVDLDRDQDHIQLIYDRDFTFLPTELFYKSGDPIEKPKNFDDMVGAAEAIGRQFEFARVDLYNTSEGLILGEITLAPGGARLRIRSPELDMWMGEQWKSAFFRPGWRPKGAAPV